MAVMASWNGKTWGVSSQRIAALNGVSSSVELDTENSDDKAGSPATKTKALKLQSMSFDFDLASAVGGDARGEFESWTSLVGQYAPFYLAGRRFGPANLQLTGVSLSDTTLDNLGRILKGKITINLTEYAEEASSKKASAGGSSKSSSAAGTLWRRRPPSERRHRRSIQQRQGCEETQQRTAQVKRGDPMKASGNGAPEICVQNLLKTIRGEVPYERIKGIDRTLIDKPSETAATDLAADVEFLVETYEPRVQLSDSDLKALPAQAGDFELRASIDNIT